MHTVYLPNSNGFLGPHFLHVPEEWYSTLLTRAPRPPFCCLLPLRLDVPHSHHSIITTRNQLSRVGRVENRPHLASGGGGEKERESVNYVHSTWEEIKRRERLTCVLLTRKPFPFENQYPREWLSDQIHQRTISVVPCHTSNNEHYLESKTNKKLLPLLTVLPWPPLIGHWAMWYKWIVCVAYFDVLSVL